MNPAEAAAVIAAARDHGFEGFSNACGEAAVAIRRVVFGGRGELVGAFNEAFLDRDVLRGHVAVLVDGAYWDADGRPKPFDEIESWGMLDPDDRDYAEEAAALGFTYDEEAAEGVAAVAFDDDAEVLERFGSGRLDRFVAALERAAAEVRAGLCEEADRPRAPGA